LSSFSGKTAVPAPEEGHQSEAEDRYSIFTLFCVRTLQLLHLDQCSLVGLPLRQAASKPAAQFGSSKTNLAVKSLRRFGRDTVRSCKHKTV